MIFHHIWMLACGHERGFPTSDKDKPVEGESEHQPTHCYVCPAKRQADGSRSAAETTYVRRVQ